MGTQPDDFEMVAASLRADSADLPTFVEALAVKLEAALPGRCEVDRHAKKLFSHDKVVRKLSLSIGDWRYTLETWKSHGWGSHVIEFFAVGTAVIPSEGGHAIPPPSPVLSLNDR